MIWNEIIEFFAPFFNDAGLTLAFGITPFGPYGLFKQKNSNGDLEFKSLRFLGINQQFWAQDTGNEIQMIVGSLAPPGYEAQDIYFAQDLTALALIPTGGLVIGDLAWVVSENDYYQWDGSAWVLFTQPIDGGLPIITMDLATFNSQQSSGSLATGHWYYITGVYVDTIWGYTWSVLARAINGSRISREVFATWNAGLAPTPAYPQTYVSATLYSDTDPSLGIVFNECVGSMMKITALQASSYNAAGVKHLRENMPVIVELTDAITLLSTSYQAFVTADGLAINDYGTALGYVLNQSTNTYYLDYNNDLAIPYSPINVRLDLTDTDLNITPSSTFDLLPAINRHTWTILSAQCSYTFNTTAYAQLFITLKSQSATFEFLTTQDLSLATGDCYIPMIDFVQAIPSNPIQFVANDKLQVFTKSNGGGDGTAIVFATAQLVRTS